MRYRDTSVNWYTWLTIVLGALCPSFTYLCGHTIVPLEASHRCRVKISAEIDGVA